MTLAALYVVALALVGFASSPQNGHGSPPGYAGQALVAQCHGAVQRGDKPASSPMKCCDACTLAAAAGLRAAPVSSFVHRTEILTRLEFSARLGADLDDRPADLRSRAPPRAA